MHTIEDVYDVVDTATFEHSGDSDMKRSNANINSDSSMGAMLIYGAETAKMWVDDKLLPEPIKKGLEDNVIYIHDKDFYGLTETCCQIRLDKLFKDGFDAGHGYIREPNSITTAAALSCIALQCNQNEMHGGQAIPALDWYLAPYVRKSYEKHAERIMNEAVALESANVNRVPELAWNATVRETEQAMEAFVHNLNTMHSRAGAQVPFSSVNYGTCTSREGRLVIRALLDATLAGLGHSETPIFPVQIFKVKEGINYNPEDPNYDLLVYAAYVSSKRLFPNFSFLDSPFNAEYLHGDDPNYEVAYMGCRTRVMGNICGTQTTGGRGNLSFTSINLPRLAIESNKDYGIFIQKLDAAMDLVKDQLLHRFEIQCNRHVYNYPFLMGNGVWKGSENLDYDDTLEKVLKEGSLSIGFIGLAEAMTAIYGKHHGESDIVWTMAYNVIKYMRKKTDAYTQEYGLNFGVIATPAEGLSGKFVERDKEKYGEIEGVTDKSYYTNSFHIPVSYNISIKGKIAKEAPFHDLCNAGHITYVELDGNLSENVDAMIEVVRWMHDAGIGYGAINHPVDYDPVCGYSGVIGDTCPCCGRKEFEAIPE